MVWQLAGWLALTVYFLLPPREAMHWGLDSSNYGSYAWMFATGRQFGADTLAMTGPFGFLAYGHTYSGYVFPAYVVGDLLFKAAFAFLVLRVFARFPSGIWRWLWVFSLLVFLPSVDDLVYDVAILTAAIVLLAQNFNRATIALAAMLLGFSVLMKGSHATTAGASLVFVVLNGFAQGNWRRGVLVAGLALATFLTGWVAAGQHLQNLPGYFHALFALTSGYNAAMGMDPTRRMFAVGLISALGFSLVLGLQAFAARRHLSRLLVVGFFALINFLQWKHGFVRADGHVYMFFGFLSLAVPLFQMVGLAVDEHVRHERTLLLGAALSALTLLVAASATSSLSLRRFAELALEVPAKLERNVRFLASPSQSKMRLEAALAHQKQLAELTDIKRDVGTRPIDFFGYEQGILLLDDFNYQPRPMGGGAFNVYHPYLQTENARALSKPAARPDFFLFKLQTIDQRLPSADDPLTLQALLSSYQPVRARRDYVLFEKSDSSAATTVRPTMLTQVPFSPGEWIDVPATTEGLLLFSLDLGSSVRGFLRNILYHPEALFLEIETTAGSAPSRFRIAPLSLQVPVLLSPLLTESSDFVALYGDPGSWSKVRRIRVLAPNGGFARSGTFSFYSFPKPPPSTEAAEEIVAYLRHPRANRTPLAIATQETGITELYGEPVTLVHAPGSITFPIEEKDQRMLFNFGIMPQAYDPGETDGVEFIVEYLPANQAPQLLFSRLLQPRTTPIDRGMQSARVYFPPQIAAGTVRIRTERGPAGNGAWDQSYVAHVLISPGSFDPRQLNGFSMAPVAPGFPDPQPVLIDGREARNLPPPAELKFRIPPGSRSATIGLGLMNAAYEGENHSDGIGYEIVAITADGQEERLRRGNLDPAHDRRARGTVTLDIDLPKVAEGSHLALRINGGPKQDDRWDWSYVQTVRFR